MKSRKLRKWEREPLFLQTIVEDSQTGEKQIIEEIEALNHFRELKFSPEGRVLKVRFNGADFWVGQKLVSNGTAPELPAGEKVVIDAFHSGSDLFVSQDCYWINVRRNNGRTAQVKPFNFKGFEDTERIEKNRV